MVQKGFKGWVLPTPDNDNDSVATGITFITNKYLNRRYINVNQKL